MSRHGDLTVRQYARADVRLEAELTIALEDQEQVRFADRCDDAINHATVTVHVVDLGTGGAGCRTGAYLPRTVAGHLRIFDPDSGSANRPVLFEQDVRVRRCELIDQEPTFLIGLSFENAGLDLGDRIIEAMNQAGQVSDPRVLGREEGPARAG